MTQSGWYPNPGGPGQRYFDGSGWTGHYAPQQYTQPGQTVSVTQPNHGLHAVLTLLTCGLWAPIWFVIAIAGSRKMQVRQQ